MDFIPLYFLPRGFFRQLLYFSVIGQRAIGPDGKEVNFLSAIRKILYCEGGETLKQDAQKM